MRKKYKVNLCKFILGNIFQRHFVSFFFHPSRNVFKSVLDILIGPCLNEIFVCSPPVSVLALSFKS